MPILYNGLTTKKKTSSKTDFTNFFVHCKHVNDIIDYTFIHERNNKYNIIIHKTTNKCKDLSK